MFIMTQLMISPIAEAASTIDVNSTKQSIAQPVYVDLSASNYVDWMHFAKDNVNDVYRKADTIASNQITFNGVGVGTSSAPQKERALDYGYYFTWQNGSGSSSATNTNSSVYYCGLNSYYEISVPAKADTTRTLDVYMGNYASAVTVTASIDGQSFPVDDIAVNSSLEKNKYSFTYTGSNTSTLTVRFTLTTAQDTAWGNLGIAGITLSESTTVSNYADPVSYLSQDMTVQLDNTNVKDWLHFDGTTLNRRAGTATADQLSITHQGTKAGFEQTSGIDAPIKVYYNNGTTPQNISNSGGYSQFTGLNSYVEVTAPSKNGVERTLNLYMGSWAAKGITVTASLGGTDIPVDDFTTTTAQTKYAKYSIKYTGTNSENLVVRFELTDNSLDTLWSSLIFSSAEMIEGEATAQKTIRFTGPSLTGGDAITAPASGYSKRRINAYVYDQGNTYPATLRVEPAVTGVSISGNLLSVSSELASSQTVTIVAEDPQDSTLTTSTNVAVIKNTSLSDTPANPIAKNGWRLFYNEEFNDTTLDTTRWSEYYIRHWTDVDEKAKADYYFEDGNIVIKTDEGIEPWSFQDGPIKVKGITTFERNHLHKFGSAYQNRDIPTFDGFATKYGYFEVRLRMPNTRDGSHFAWWMTGVQDDMNISAQLSGQNTYAGHYSNETAEFDNIENSIEVLSTMKNWKVPIHPNGTTDIQYQHLTATTIPGDPSNEFHIYGFEWDETGCKFYLDNQLVATTDRTPNYRMMTYFNVYAEGGMGDDRGIYPKEAIIDYFRVYKKDEAAKATSIALNGGESPNYIKVPDTGSNQVPMTAVVLDQFDVPFTANVQWKLSTTIDGFTPVTSSSANLTGVTINQNTGVVTVDSSASLNQDVFVTAYVNNTVKQTKHIKLSKGASVAERVIFNAPKKAITAGQSLDLSAVLYDQYKESMSTQVTYQLSTDLTGNTVTTITGVSVDANGLLTVDSSVASGTIITVTAKAAGKYQSCVLKVN